LVRVWRLVDGTFGGLFGYNHTGVVVVWLLPDVVVVCTWFATATGLNVRYLDSLLPVVRVLRLADAVTRDGTGFVLALPPYQAPHSCRAAITVGVCTIFYLTLAPRAVTTIFSLLRNVNSKNKAERVILLFCLVCCSRLTRHAAFFVTGCWRKRHLWFCVHTSWFTFWFIGCTVFSIILVLYCVLGIVAFWDGSDLLQFFCSFWLVFSSAFAGLLSTAHRFAA
jgi:hypothetical protein